jgi:hypothetical protein
VTNGEREPKKKTRFSGGYMRIIWTAGTYLGLDEMTYADFGHDGDSYGIDDLFDHMRVTLRRRIAEHKVSQNEHAMSHRSVASTIR